MDPLDGGATQAPPAALLPDSTASPALEGEANAAPDPAAPPPADPPPAGPPPNDDPGPPASPHLAAQRRRVGIALGVSLLAHALLLSLTFGDQDLGLPGLGLPWQVRLGQLPELRVRLVPTPIQPQPQPTVPVQVPVPELAAAPAAPATPAPPTTTARPAAETTPDAVAPSLAAAPPTAAPAGAAVERTDAPAAVAPDPSPASAVVALALPQDTSLRVPADPPTSAAAAASSPDTARREAEQHEAARQEAARQQAALLDMQRQDAARREAALQDAVRLEATRQETTRQETTRLEATRQEAARQAAALQAVAQQEAARAASAREAAASQAATRATSIREDTTRPAPAPDPAAKREALLRAIGRQLDEEAAQRDARAAATGQPGRPGQPAPSTGNARRGRLFGRSDANAELVLYAEAWARKIQLNMTFELVRDAAKRPHNTPLVTVAVRSDGSVESVTFVTSSGVAEIDDAVRRVVQSQAPYAAFPPALAREFDVVEIRRSWHFDMAIRLD